MMSPYVANVSSFDSYGRPVDAWGTGPTTLGGVGQYTQGARDLDASMSQAMGSQFVDPNTGQLLRQPTTPGEAAAAADAMDKFNHNQDVSRNQKIMSLLGGGGQGSGSASGPGGVSPGNSMRGAFESSLMDTVNHPGMGDAAMENIINKGSEEISAGEQNSMRNLNQMAGAQGAGGGAVSGANREVMSDFAGKRATLARDTRTAGAESASQQKLGALNAGANYYGKMDDNARADRNALVGYLSNQQNTGSQHANSGQFSGLMSQAGQNNGLSYTTMPGGTTKPKGNVKGDATNAGFGDWAY